MLLAALALDRLPFELVLVPVLVLVVLLLLLLLLLGTKEPPELSLDADLLNWRRIL